MKQTSQDLALQAPELDIAVIGGGIAGLSSALGLLQIGHRVALFEKASQPQEVGAGLQLAPNATRALSHLGVLEDVRAKASRPQNLALINAQGETLASLNLHEQALHWGYPYLTIHRADLHEVLWKAVSTHEKSTCHHSHKLMEAAVRGGDAWLKLESPSGIKTTTASYAIGADGLHSHVRHCLFRETPRDDLVHHGRTAWRALAPITAQTSPQIRENSLLWLLNGAHAVTYPLRRGGHLNVVLVERTSDGEKPQSLNKQLPPELLTVFNTIESWKSWPMRDRNRLSRWVRGPFALCGDAAHPMLPHMAQGAAQALEDAVALSAAFAAEPSNPLGFYARQRMDKAHRVQGQSRRNGLILGLQGWPARARDASIKALGKRAILSPLNDLM